MRALLFFVFPLSMTCFAACATASDDPGLEIKHHDAGHDVGTPTPDAGLDTSVTTTTDSGRPATDSGSSADTYVAPPDTGSYYDTYTPPPDDTGTGIDTYTPPPTDTGIGGGTCIYCSSGSCPDPITEEFCFIDCISAGYSDCTMSGPTCTCIP